MYIIYNVQYNEHGEILWDVTNNANCSESSLPSDIIRINHSSSEVLSVLEHVLCTVFFFKRCIRRWKEKWIFKLYLFSTLKQCETIERGGNTTYYLHDKNMFNIIYSYIEKSHTKKIITSSRSTPTNKSI